MMDFEIKKILEQIRDGQLDHFEYYVESNGFSFTIQYKKLDPEPEQEEN